MHSAISSRCLSARYALPGLMLACLVGGLGQVAEGAVAPQVFQGGGVPIQVPPDIAPGTADVTCLVSNITTPISAVTLSLFCSHAYPNDVTITLVGPDGTAVVISARNGGNNRGSPGTGYGTSTQDGPTGTGIQQYGQVIFDDKSTRAILFVDATGGGGGGGGGGAITQTSELPSARYRPDESLAAFNGKSGTAANGVWHLLVNDVDGAYLDSGLLQVWSLSIEQGGGHIWTGTTSSSWNVATNWQDDNIPKVTEAAAILIFPAGPTNKTTINNIAGGTIKVTSLTVAAGYDMSGTAITLNAGGSIAASDPNGGTIAWGLPVNMAGAGTFSVGTNVIVNETALGVFADLLTATAAGILTKGGPGLLNVQANNTYTGATNINAGILRLNNAGGLGTVGTGAAGTVVGASGTLELTTIVTTEGLTLNGPGSVNQGALSATTTQTWAGAIVLGNTDASVGAVTGTTLTLSGVITGNDKGFVKRDAGTVAVTTSSLPTGTALDVKDGTLNLSATANPIASLAMTQGTLNFGNNTLTLNGALTVTGSAGGAIINPVGGTLALSAGAHAFAIANGAAANDLTINCIVTGATGAAKSGAGTLTWNAPAGSTAPVTMSAGELAGNGTMGALTVTGGTVNPTGTLNTGNLTLGTNSIYRVDPGSQLSVTGAVVVNDAILQPYIAAGTIIANDTAGDPVTGTFRGMPGPAGIGYALGDGNDVVLSLGASVISFGAAAYTVNEPNGPAIITVNTSGPATVAIGWAGGGTPGVDFILPAATVFGGAGTFNIPIQIINNNIATGNLLVNLVLIPTAGHLDLAPTPPASSTATLTIVDDDSSDKKKCGFGSGLTVFFLMLGFALVRLVAIRRR